VVAVAGLSLAAAASRRGDEALGFGLCAVTGLLISPISWIHHWVIVIPALLAAGLTAARAYRAGNVATAVVVTATITASAAIGWIELAGETPRSGWLALPTWVLVRSVCYVLIGLAVLVAGAWSQVRSALSRAAPAGGSAAHGLGWSRDNAEDCTGPGQCHGR
jgi:alpha-1,2-mannosyltransferase